MIIRRIAQGIKNQDWFVVGVEIMVVVVGIFVGLQVTDWNEERKEHAARAIYLVRLSDDLMLMRAAIANDMVKMQSLEHGAKRSLYALEICQLDPADTKEIQSSFNAYQSAPAVSIYREAFDEMQATGAFARLVNNSLKSRIAGLYSGLENFEAIDTFMRRDLSAAGQIMWSKIDFSFDPKTGRGLARFDLLNFCDDRLMRNAIWELADTRGDWARFASRYVDEIDALLIDLQSRKTTR